MPDIFYQHRILENPIDLYLNPKDSEIKFLGNTLNFYENENTEKLTLKATAKINDINSVLPSEYKNASEYLDLILLVKSVKSIFRKCYIFEKTGNIFKTELNLNKQDWRNDVVVSALLILKKNIKENNGYASDKGTQLGWSSAYKIYFDKPEEKFGGASMDLQWESFSGDKLQWLNKHYSKDVYTLDLARGNKMPKIYLNSDIDHHLKSLLTNTSNRSSLKTSSRDLMFQTISNSIFTQLLTDSLIEFNKNLLDPDNKDSDKEVAIDAAWEELQVWKKQIIENYAHKILPDSRKKDALENLKENIYENQEEISDIMKKILNIAQNSSEYSTHKIFTENAKLLLRKDNK